LDSTLQENHKISC